MRKNSHRKFLDEGFLLDRVIKNSELAEKLKEFLAEVSNGYYEDFRIIPAEIARENEEWLLVEKSHLVYGRISQNHPAYNKIKEAGNRKLVSALCRHVITREEAEVLVDY